jgi:hypothetical protein
MPEAESQSRQAVPPYVPYKTFIGFLDTLKSVGLPSHIDKDAMRSMSGANQSWLKAAMRYLNLIDSASAPTETLKLIVAADAARRKELLHGLFVVAYADLLSKVDLQNTTPTKLRAALVDMGGQGETVEKNAAFLIAMAKDAGISLSPYLLKRAAPTRRTKPARVKPREDENGRDDDVDDDDGGSTQLTPEQMLIDLLDPSEMDDDEKKAVWTLLLYLKKQAR